MSDQAETAINGVVESDQHYHARARHKRFLRSKEARLELERADYTAFRK
jgi:hypothetical protein